MAAATWHEKPSFLGRWGMRIFWTLLAFVMIFPFVYILSISFSNFNDVAGKGLVLIPAHPTLDAYNYVLASGVVTRAVGVSLFVTIVGTLVNLFMTVTMAYGLSRRGVPGRGFILGLVAFTILFAPGIIPKYLVVKQLGLLDNLWALILPGAISAFNLVVIRNSFMSIPEELIESAKLDGANDLRILWNFVLPLSGAVVAAIGLFYGVGHWNSFFDATLYINDPAKWPVQLVLRQFVLQGAVIQDVVVNQQPPPSITIQMAVVVLATIPILIVYPFLQKYFTKGVLTGSIKG
ncbi:MAG: carbohydrate transporter permease [Chloroflexi bacterium]|jgi:putative aldouronate transport system permease protein|nr:carbohydrate transporter permease [Chloroflexota bacterium]